MNKLSDTLSNNVVVEVINDNFNSDDVDLYLQNIINREMYDEGLDPNNKEHVRLFWTQRGIEP